MVVGALYHRIDGDGRASAGTEHAAKFRQARHRIGKEHQSEIAQYRIETRIRE